MAAERKALFAGSGALSLTPETARLVLGELESLDTDVKEILLRRPRGNYPRPFEALVNAMASQMDFRVTWFKPSLGGRSATFLRDVQMVMAADEVVCFFPPDHLMEGGTGHIVEKALDQEKPVRAYELSPAGLRWIGGHNESKES